MRGEAQGATLQRGAAATGDLEIMLTIKEERPAGNFEGKHKTTPKARTASSRAIREQVRLQASYVSQRLTIIKATRRTLRQLSCLKGRKQGRD